MPVDALVLGGGGPAGVAWTSALLQGLIKDGWPLAEAPLGLGTLDPQDRDDPMGAFTRSASFTPFTPPCNISGQPAISLPLFQREDGLPLGVQFIGQPAQEGALLALATQLEEASDWTDRRPNL